MQRREFLHAVTQTALTTTGLAVWSQTAVADRPAEKIRVGQIGTGHAHAAGKLQTLRKLSELYEVVGIVEPDPARRNVLERNPAYKGLPVLTEEQLFNVPRLQAVAVETAVRDLVPTAHRCIKAGLHVHLDKPAGESLPAFRDLLDEAGRRKRTVQMGYMFRYNPAFQLCFQAVREGWLGEVFEVHGIIGKKVGRNERIALAEYPGGAMFELGCHLIDALVAALGKPDKVVPFVRRMHPEQDSLADNPLAVFEYPQATATIRSPLVDPHGFARRQFTVAGTQGTIEIRPLEPPKLSLFLEQPRSTWKAGRQEVELPRMPGRYDGEFLDLAAIIRGEKEPDYTAAHDLAVHESVLTASGLPTK